MTQPRGYRVVPVRTKWVASRQAPGRQPASAQDAVNNDCFGGIVGTAWEEAA